MSAAAAAWAALAVAELRQYYRVRGTFVGPLVFLAVTGVVELCFWATLAGADGSVGTYARGEFLAYALAALVVAQITAVSGRPDALASLVEDGGLDAVLVRPRGAITLLGAPQLGMVAARLLFLVPLLALAQTLLAPHTVSAAAWLALAAILPLAGLVNFLVNATIATLAFRFRESYAFVQVKETLFWVLSGALLPLDFLPGALRDALPWFPPAYVVYYPVQALLGRASAADVVVRLAVCAAATAVVFTIAYRAGLRRYQAYGG